MRKGIKDMFWAPNIDFDLNYYFKIFRKQSPIVIALGSPNS